MGRSEVLDRLDEERRCLQRDGEVVEVVPPVTRLRAADGSHHNVIYSAITPGTADEIIGREVEHHRWLGVGFEWKVYAHDAPPDLVDRLRRRGFEIGPREAVLCCGLDGPPEWVTEQRDAVRVERVDGPEGVAAYRRVAEAVFGKDFGFTAGQLAAALLAGSDQHRGYVAYDRGEPVSIGRLYTHPQSRFGGLYGGATIEAYRGRGFYRAVVAARARDALAGGARHLVVDALPTSEPVLRRMGFRPLTATWPCEWRPPGGG